MNSTVGFLRRQIELLGLSPGDIVCFRATRLSQTLDNFSMTAHGAAERTFANLLDHVLHVLTLGNVNFARVFVTGVAVRRTRDSQTMVGASHIAICATNILDNVLTESTRHACLSLSYALLVPGHPTSWSLTIECRLIRPCVQVVIAVLDQDSGL